MSVKLFFVIFFSLNVYLSDCYGADSKGIQKNEAIENFETKLDRGTLTYKDIFEADFGEFNDKNENNKKILEELSEKNKKYVKMCNKDRNRNETFCIDNIVKNNIDKIVLKILDKKSMKYGLYGSNNNQWFAENKTLKSSLNYMQQKCLLSVSGGLLEIIGAKIIDKIIANPEEYEITFGELWVVYGNGCELTKSFNTLNNFLIQCKTKINNGKTLSNAEILMLKNIYKMKNMENIVINDAKEYLSKKILLSKTKNFIEKAQELLQLTNNL